MSASLEMSVAIQTERTAEFDAKVIAHLPLIAKFGRKYAMGGSAEDLASDITAYALKHWRAYNSSYPFSSWLSFKARELTSTSRRKGALNMVDNPRADCAIAASQEDHTLLKQVVALASKTKSGRILLRRAQGDTLRELATEYGCSNQSISQYEQTARRRLLKVAA